MPKRSRTSEEGNDRLAVERMLVRPSKRTPGLCGTTPGMESDGQAGHKPPVGRGERMIRARPSVLAAMVLLAGALTLSLVLLTRGSAGSGQTFVSKLGQSESAAETPGLGPNSYEAYLQAQRTYPANVIPASISARAKATYKRIARADARRLKNGRSFLADQNQWKLYGPRVDAIQPGVTSFSGATNATASRVTALLA